MSTIKVRPARPGDLVPDPAAAFAPIPETGVLVPATNTYWARRIQAGDVVVVEEAEPAASPSSEPPAPPPAPRQKRGKGARVSS